MADRKVEYLLIGGGLASANCARWLREEGAEGEVLLVGRELDPPYNRPDCSKGYLRGEESREDPLFRPDAWWAEQNIELLTRTSVTGLDLAARTAKLSSKEEVEFGKALIATGANVRRLNVEGCDLDQIHYLRTLGNADAIREGVGDAEEVVLIGGSYIGCEVAASLTMMGKRCTIVMQEQVTLERGFGPSAGRFFQDLLESHGVTVHASDELERFDGDGRVAKVITRNGLELPAEAVVIGAGVTPDVALAKKAGLQIGERGGVRCYSRLESFAARHLRCGRHLRVRLGAPRRRSRADRALGRRLQPRQDRRAQHARARRSPRGGSLLLLGARQLGRAGVRRAGLRWDRRFCAAPAGRLLHHLVPEGRPAQGGAHVRALRGPAARPAADSRGGPAAGAPRALRSPISTPIWTRPGGS